MTCFRANNVALEQWFITGVTSINFEEVRAL